MCSCLYSLKSCTASPITIPIIFDEGTRTLTGADCTYERSVIFNSGDSERSFRVTIVDDDLVEGDESVTFGFDLGLLSGTVVPSTTVKHHAHLDGGG